LSSTQVSPTAKVSKAHSSALDDAPFSALKDGNFCRMPLTFKLPLNQLNPSAQFSRVVFTGKKGRMELEDEETKSQAEKYLSIR
jgi:hypothetical protein